MKTVTGVENCVAQIRKNMTAAGCSEAHIEDAISNYHKLNSEKAVEVAVLA